MEDKTIELTKELLLEIQKEMPFAEKGRAKKLSFFLQNPKWRAFITALTDQCFRTKDAKRSEDQIRYLLNRFDIPSFLSLFTPFIKKKIKKEMGHVLLFENSPFPKGVKINLNHLGEAILGEKEAESRLEFYLKAIDLVNVDCISVKVSTLFSQISLIGFDETLAILKERLRRLYRRAGKQKFVYLDMEESKDLDLTCALFQELLSEPEFLAASHGIALQSYLPESFEILKNFCHFALKRKGPLCIRIVKGANLAMEKVESSLRNWPQAPFLTKVETDANFLKMVDFAVRPEFKERVHVGIGSHNLFDIAFAMLLSKEREVPIRFEMLHGMAETMQKVIQKRSGEMLLYCPQTSVEEFQYACPYLTRRLDENTGPENFLRYIYDIKVDNAIFNDQKERFKQSFRLFPSLTSEKRRVQNRTLIEKEKKGFENVADTDFSLAVNRKWISGVYNTWKEKKSEPIDLDSHLKPVTTWNISQEKRALILKNVAHHFKEERGNLIGAMIQEGNKIVEEGDVEVSEAIDFIEYYRQTPFELEPKGTILIAPPWNFPCSIPTGGIAAALIAGNAVLFKPAPETVFVGLKVIELFWKGGVPKEVLQFIPCKDEPEGNELIKDRRIDCVVLTGGTETAKKFKTLRPSLDLIAETGGKNTMIITALSDRDLAISDLVKSAFGHAGQKCSACSLAILEKEVYDDPKFLAQLKDATTSLIVGSPWDPLTRVPPLIRPPEGALLRAFEKLEEGESWLVAPKPSHNTPCIKLGVQEGSFTHQTELFGPILGLMRAENLDHAIHLANGTPYGLTAGLHSLDEREHAIWKEKIVAGNLYINRTITGAIVQRQPFGGTKASSYGPGAKAGGPHYVLQMSKLRDTFPVEKASLPKDLIPLIARLELTKEEMSQWKISAASYAYWAKTLKEAVDPSKVLGQDNLFYHVPHSHMVLRIEEGDKRLHIMQIIAAAICAKTPLEVSSSVPFSGLETRLETQEAFLKRMTFQDRVRALSPLDTIAYVISSPPFLNGRFEMLHYLREVSLSVNTHRYGYINLDLK